MLKMTMAATTSEISAKIRMASVSWLVKWIAAVASELASWLPVCTWSPRSAGQGAQPRHQGGLGDAGPGAGHDLVVAGPPGHRERGRRREGGHGGVLDGVVHPEADRGDQAEAAHGTGLGREADELAEPEVLVGGGAGVHGHLIGGARQVPRDHGETAQRRVAGHVDAQARAGRRC